MSTTPQNRQTLSEDFSQLGLPHGAPLLVHSALSSLGWVEGGAPAVVEALVTTATPKGTVLFPTLTGTAADSPDNRPHSDQRLRSTWCGAIPCAALHHPACHRSIHPTHAVAAIGPDAGDLTAGHSSAQSPCGQGSPYTRLADAGGYILLLGVRHDANTTFHTAEELADAPYVSFPGRYPCTVIDTLGKHHEVRTPIHRWDRPRIFESWHDQLLAHGIVRELRIAQAPCRLMRAQDLIDWLVGQLRRSQRALLAPHSPYP